MTFNERQSNVTMTQGVESANKSSKCEITVCVSACVCMCVHISASVLINHVTPAGGVNINEHGE